MGNPPEAAKEFQDFDIFLKGMQRQIHRRRGTFEAFGGSGMKALNIEQEDTSPGIRDLQESTPRVITLCRHVGMPQSRRPKHYYFFWPEELFADL